MDIVKFHKDNMFQEIKASMMDRSFKLSPAAQEKKLRLEHAFALRHKNKYSRFQVVDFLMKEYGCSRATAYRDYAWAMQIMGDLDATNKNAERVILGEAYWQIYQMALKDRNLKIALRSLNSFQSLFNFGADEEPIDPNKIQAHEYHIHLSREGNKILRETLKTGVVDFMSVTAEEAEFEEVENDEV